MKQGNSGKQGKQGDRRNVPPSHRPPHLLCSPQVPKGERPGHAGSVAELTFTHPVRRPQRCRSVYSMP